MCCAVAEDRFGSNGENSGLTSARLLLTSLVLWVHALEGGGEAIIVPECCWAN
jgi:hypothetical protein